MITKTKIKREPGYMWAFSFLQREPFQQILFKGLGGNIKQKKRVLI